MVGRFSAFLLRYNKWQVLSFFLRTRKEKNMLPLVMAMTLFMQTTEGDPFREVEKLRREVEMLRSLNDLQLTREQMSQIVLVSEKSVLARKQAVEEAGKSLKVAEEALRALRDALRVGGDGVREAEKAFREVEKGSGESIRAIMKAGFSSLVEGKKILTEKQREKIARMGRPDPNQGLQNMVAGLIERVRDENNREMDERLVEIVFRQMERMAERMKLSEEEVEAEVDRVVSIIDEAIDAEDEAYAKNRDAYLDRIFEEGKLGASAPKSPARPAARPERGGGEDRPNPLDRRLMEFFSNPGVLAALKLRLAQEE
jgi:hypothetical protein